jgi:hypothetical protein
MFLRDVVNRICEMAILRQQCVNLRYGERIVP